MRNNIFLIHTIKAENNVLFKYGDWNLIYEKDVKREKEFHNRVRGGTPTCVFPV